VLWGRSTPADTELNWPRAFLLTGRQEPGSWFVYNTAATYILTSSRSDRGNCDYRPRLFDPLGIENAWKTTRINLGARRNHINSACPTLEDVPQGGVWEGRQLVPAAWVANLQPPDSDNSNAPPAGCGLRLPVLALLALARRRCWPVLHHAEQDGPGHDQRVLQVVLDNGCYTAACHGSQSLPTPTLRAHVRCVCVPTWRRRRAGFPANNPLTPPTCQQGGTPADNLLEQQPARGASTSLPLHRAGLYGCARSMRTIAAGCCDWQRAPVNFGWEPTIRMVFVPEAAGCKGPPLRRLSPQQPFARCICYHECELGFPERFHFAGARPAAGDRAERSAWQRIRKLRDTSGR
jgi:hypothetical protein